MADAAIASSQSEQKPGHGSCALHDAHTCTQVHMVHLGQRFAAVEARTAIQLGASVAQTACGCVRFGFRMGTSGGHHAPPLPHQAPTTCRCTGLCGTSFLMQQSYTTCVIDALMLFKHASSHATATVAAPPWHCRCHVCVWRSCLLTFAPMSSDSNPGTRRPARRQVGAVLLATSCSVSEAQPARTSHSFVPSESKVTARTSCILPLSLSARCRWTRR